MVGGAHGNYLEPLSFGGHGGSGGGESNTDCHEVDGEGNEIIPEMHKGGLGGGIIELIATTTIEIYGTVESNGLGVENGRSGGGAGGGIYLSGSDIRGEGIVMANGGSVTGDQTCGGGGGAGGRIATHHSENQYFFLGSMSAVGGSSAVECGGAGTVTLKDKDNDVVKLFVDNENRCEPLSDVVDFSLLDDQNRGKDSFRTFLFDLADDNHDHQFGEISISGGAMVALFRRSIDEHEQTIRVETTSGDKSGIIHVGPNQVHA